jgi:hypothetical protein
LVAKLWREKKFPAVDPNQLIPFLRAGNLKSVPDGRFQDGGIRLFLRFVFRHRHGSGPTHPQVNQKQGDQMSF